jgi:hypothetical protein
MLAPRQPARGHATDVHFQVLKNLLRKHLLEHDTESAVQVARILFRHAARFATDARANVPKESVELFSVCQIGTELLHREGGEKISRWLQHLSSLAKGELTSFILLEFVMYLVNGGKTKEAQTRLETHINVKQSSALMNGYHGLLCYLLWREGVEVEKRNDRRNDLYYTINASQASINMSQISLMEDLGPDASQVVEEVQLEGENKLAAMMRQNALKSLRASFDKEPHFDLFLLVYLQLLHAEGQFDAMRTTVARFLENNPRNVNAHLLYLRFARSKNFLHLNLDLCANLMQLDPAADDELTIKPLVENDRFHDVQFLDHLLRYLDAQPTHAWSWEKLFKLTNTMIESSRAQWKPFAESRRDWWPSFVFKQLDGLQEDVAVAKERASLLIQPRPQFVDTIRHFRHHWLVILRLFPQELMAINRDLQQVLAQCPLEQTATTTFLGNDAFEELHKIQSKFVQLAPAVVLVDGNFVGTKRKRVSKSLDPTTALAELKDLLSTKESSDEKNKRILDLIVHLIPNKPGRRPGKLSIEALKTQHRLNLPNLFVKYLEIADKGRHHYVATLEEALKTYRAIPGRRRTVETAMEKETCAAACHEAAMNVRKHVLDELNVIPKVLDPVLNITFAQLVHQPIPIRGFNRK